MTKFFDILPPDKKSISIDKIEKPKKPKGKGLFLKFLISFIFVFGLIIYLSGFFYSELSLSLIPETETEIFETEIEINTFQTDLNLENKIIPGSLFETEKEKSEKYNSFGKSFIEGKAQGIIRVYNSQNPPTPIKLVINTRFLSSQEGRIFKAAEKIYLPSAKIKQGKIEPSFKDIKVLAQEPGEEYNINPSKFSVPGLTGTPYYYSVWAESFNPMEGGFKKEVKIITEEDLETAKNSLKKDLENLAKNALKEQLPQGLLLTEKGTLIKDFQVSCDGKPEEQKSEFNCQGKIKIAGVGFKDSDLKNLAINFIKSNIDSSKEFIVEDLALEYSFQGLIIDKGKMFLNLKIKADIYDKISKEDILSKIKGKSKQEIKEIIFENYPQIKKIKFKFQPFWIKKAPNSLERIKIKIQL